MPPSRLAQIVAAAAVITIISLVGERYRTMAGILASMPVILPISLAIIFLNTQGDHLRTAEFTRAATIGLIGTGIFLLVAWWALNRQWPLWLVIGAGYVGWAAFLLLVRLATRLLTAR